MRKIKRVIVHCSYTSASMDIGLAEIKQWHTRKPPKGRGWKDIGYHFIIRRDATLENGRAIEKVGAHTLGENADSVGVCLVGGKEGNKSVFNFTRGQMQILRELCHSIMREYGLGRADLHGHNEYNKHRLIAFFATY